MCQSATVFCAVSPTPFTATLSPATLASSAVVSSFFPTSSTAFSAIAAAFLAAAALLPPLVVLRLRFRRHWAGATTVQAAWRGHAARSALRDLHCACDQLRRELGEPMQVSLVGAYNDFYAGLVRPGNMDVYSRLDDEYIDIRGMLRDHMATLAYAALIVQSSLRRLLVRRCLLPAATLVRQIALSREMGRTPIDPGRAITPADLYLRYVEGGTSWVYCDRDTRFDVVDALALLRPHPVPVACRASNAAQRARQRDAFDRELRGWRRWRRTTLKWHEVTEVGGRLYRPRHSGPGKQRHQTDMLSRAVASAPSPRGMALADWLRAGRDEALFAPTWDVWCESYDGDFDTFVFGAYEDFDDYVLFDAEGEGEFNCERSDDDELDLAGFVG